MKGFSDRILVILPKEETVSGASYMYKSYFKTIISKITKVFKQEFDMQTFYLRSNMLDDYPVIGAKQIYDFCPSDSAFLKRVAFISPVEDNSFSEIKDMAKEKFRHERGMSDIERFAVIDSRQRFIGNKIIQEYRVVIDFQKTNNKYYTVKPVAGDKMKIFVNFNTFTVTGFIGDINIPVKELFQKDYACMPMYQWEGFK